MSDTWKNVRCVLWGRCALFAIFQIILYSRKEDRKLIFWGKYTVQTQEHRKDDLSCIVWWNWFADCFLLSRLHCWYALSDFAFSMRSVESITMPSFILWRNEAFGSSEKTRCYWGKCWWILLTYFFPTCPKLKWGCAYTTNRLFFL